MRRLAWFLAAVLMVGCKPSAPREFSLRQISTHYAFTITPDQAPPFAREAVLYKVVVVDRDTRGPLLGRNPQAVTLFTRSTRGRGA